MGSILPSPLKVPFVDEIVFLDTRTRKNVEDHPAATKEQMSVTARVSVNWTESQGSQHQLLIEYEGVPRWNGVMRGRMPGSDSKTLLSMKQNIDQG